MTPTPILMTWPSCWIPPVERSDREGIALRPQGRRGEMQASAQERLTQPTAGQVGPQPQADLGHRPGEFHHEEAGQRMGGQFVRGEVLLSPSGGIQQLGQVIRIGVGVIEGVLARIPPGGNRVCVSCRHWPDRELQHRHTVHPTNQPAIRRLGSASAAK